MTYYHLAKGFEAQLLRCSNMTGVYTAAIALLVIVHTHIPAVSVLRRAI